MIDTNGLKLCYFEAKLRLRGLIENMTNSSRSFITFGVQSVKFLIKAAPLHGSVLVLPSRRWSVTTTSKQISFSTFVRSYMRSKRGLAQKILINKQKSTFCNLPRAAYLTPIVYMKFAFLAWKCGLEAWRSCESKFQCVCFCYFLTITLSIFLFTQVHAHLPYNVCWKSRKSKLVICSLSQD